MNKRKYKDSLYPVRPITDLKDMIEQSAELFAEKPAYMVKDRPGGEYRKIYYRQFKADIDALGTCLLRMGLQGKKIAVLGDSSYKWIVSYFAVVNGVGVVVPLDKDLPIHEMESLLKRAGVSAVACSGKLESKLAEALFDGTDVEIVIRMDAPAHGSEDSDFGDEIEAYSFDKLIEEGTIRIQEGNRSFLNAEIDPDEMCTLIFTSGTTGLAKGVMLSHRNLSQNVYNMSQYVDVGEDGVGLSVLPMHHTFEMTCHIMTGIYQGLCVAICEGLKHIMKNMAEAQATIMLGVPLLFEQIHKRIMKQAEQSGSLPKLRKGIELSKKYKLYNNPAIVRRMFAQIHEVTGGRMRQFISGGAAINPEVISDFEAMGIPMLQGYGMTENSPIIAVNRDRYGKHDSVGCPIPGTEVKLVGQDETGMGEIVCRGSSVMLGYYDNPEDTEQVLQDGWLYTGDYGRFDEDGFLYIMGRKKNVIVTKNGKNIFPEEVEYYLLKHDYIEEALVMGMEDERSGDTVVKAIIYPNYELIGKENGYVTKEEARRIIKGIVDEINEEMPPYKRVKRISLRDTEFEKTTTKKIKRFAQGNIEESE